MDIVTSTSFFVPKPFTPFQWVAQNSNEQFLDKQRFLNHKIKDQINHKSIKYNWHDVELTRLEGILARGDRKLCRVLLAAYENGCLYDSWSENFKYDMWLKAFEDTGVDPDFYTLRERSTDEILPWDFIDAGVSKQFLIREWERAKENIVTPNCRQGCSACGCKAYGGGVCYEN